MRKLIASAVIILASIESLSSGGVCQDDRSLESESSVQAVTYSFEEDDDLNYDRWPDRWTRRKGTGYPVYQEIGIVKREQGPDAGDPFLRVELNGGAAEITSPELEIDTRFSYYLDFDAFTFETARDEANQAWVTVDFFNERGEVIARYESPKIQRVAEFRRYRIGPMIQPSDEPCWARIRLRVQPTRTADLFGGAGFDNISLIPYPKLLTETNQPFNIYLPNRTPEITLRLSGVQERDARLAFQLLDPFGEPLSAIEERSLSEAGQPQNDSSGSRSDNASGTGESFETLLDELREVEQRRELNRQLTVHWQPPVQGSGFYQVRVQLLVGDEVRLERMLTLAVVDDQVPAADQHFGWTLPTQPVSTPLPQLTELIRLAGIRWVKYPVWYAKSDSQSAEWIAEFAERLSEAEIQLVGIIDHPPAEHMDAFNANDQGIASLLREPELWQPAINHVLARLSLKVHWWQLGADDDLSFVGYPNLLGKVTEIRDTLSRYAKDMSLGINWQWLHHFPASEQLPWDFRLYRASPDLTEAELVEYLKLEEEHPERVWTTLQPLPRDEYSLQTRVRDLVSRMIRIKMAGATGFVTEPFSNQQGLMQEDGTPGELFLPWRTTSFQLAGTEYIGQVRLPNGSTNFIFSDGQTATMLVWNESPVVEKLYLGEEVRVTDIWGASEPVPLNSERHRIEVDAWPRFVSGLDPNVARFRMQFRFDRTTLASIFGQRQFAGLMLENVFARGASGTIKLHSEQLWAKPIEVPIKVAGGEAFSREFPIVLRSFASTGVHPVRVDVTLDADRRYEFSVFREIQVGFGKVDLQHQLERLDGGGLRVYATLINNSYDTVSFDCFLLVPGRRKQRRQLLKLGHGRETVEFYIRHEPRKPVKTVWIRAEEIRGNRILNHHFEVDLEKPAETGVGTP